MLSPSDEHPIAALASGFGAIGVIRISGALCWDVVKPCFQNSLPPPDRRAVRKSLVDPMTGEVVDDLILISFKGPKSYTGQDTIELSCHGGTYIIQRVLSVLYGLGVRAAVSGEFTKRALLNGKLDLAAAEGIRELVEAQSRQQWLAGRQLYTGKLKFEIEALRQEVIGAMAYLEAMIDFPDEGDTQQVGLDHVRERLENVTVKLKNLISSFQSGLVASRGLLVALIGAPNAGKSTLLNTLLGKQRAIVSAIPGTTRDYIEESCLIDGRLIRLVDTAGIRETNDQIEREGVSLSKKFLETADLVLALYSADSDGDGASNIFEPALPIKSSTKPLVNVLTKVDLGRPAWAQDMLGLSCTTGVGLPELKAKLVAIVDQHTGSLEERPFLTSARQQAALLAASKSLDHFRDQDQKGAGHEMLAFELQEATRSLSSVIGDVSNEDILDKVFSDFCIGK